LKATARDFSSHVEAVESIPRYMNVKTAPLTKEHNSKPWEFQQTDGRPQWRGIGLQLNYP
jgi:hypothetical protein